MALGPGKYDGLCSTTRIAADADAVALIVLNGTHGSGFSIQSHGPDVMLMLPELLRHMADHIEKDLS